MDTTALSRQVSFRPSEYDVEVLKDIQQKNPHLNNTNDLIRHALRIYHVETTDSNSKGKRLERIEHVQMQILERLLSLENKVERLAKVPVSE